MTEQDLRARVCSQAWAWKGKREADNSYWPIIEIYNSIHPLPRGYKMQRGDFWCAAFVSALAQFLGLTAWIFPECSCPKMITLYKAAGRWMEDDSYLPQPGDVIFYDWQDSGVGDNTGTADHVGVVVEVDGETITVMEGNCGKAVATRQLQRNGRYIRGFGLPDYAAAASAINAHEDPDDEPPAVEVPEDSYQLTLNVLRQGDQNEEVRAAQLLLIGRGYSCGPDGADGEFGPNTCLAVREFQHANGFAESGRINHEVMAALHGR